MLSCSGFIPTVILFPVPLSVLNESSQEEVSVRDVRILPNLNASYLPVMPDGSVLLVDNVWCVYDPFKGFVPRVQKAPPWLLLSLRVSYDFVFVTLYLMTVLCIPCYTVLDFYHLYHCR